MILTSQFDVEQLFENRFNVDFIQASLKQRGNSTPKIFSGPANVTMDANGDLTLKLYHLSLNAQSLLTDFAGEINSSNLKPGKLISDEHYFDFEGLDSIANKWTATQLWLTQQVSIQTGGIVITAKLSSIGIIRNPLLAAASATAYFSSAFNISLFHAKSVGVMTGFRSVELDIDNRKVVIKHYPSFYELTAELHDVDNPEDLFDTTLEALSIAFGINLGAKIRCLSTATGSKIEIFSSSTIQTDVTILTPINVSEYAMLSNISNFASCYVKTFTKGNEVLARFWARVINAFQGNVEINALALTTAIEGILDEYYKASVQDDTELAIQLHEASIIIDKHIKDDRAKKILNASISGAKNIRAKSILYALARNGCISEEQADLWVRLRNKSAHAGKLKLGHQDIQKYMNQLYGCLELFYRLILGRISFSGEIRMYSIDSWPYGQVKFDYETLLKGTVSPESDLTTISDTKDSES